MKTSSHFLKVKRTQKAGFSFLAFVAILTVIPIILIIGYIVVQGTPALSIEFLTDFPSNGMRDGGILPAIIGTFYLTLGTAIFSVPLGIGAAIYLSEYAEDNFLTRAIRIAIIKIS